MGRVTVIATVALALGASACGSGSTAKSGAAASGPTQAETIKAADRLCEAAHAKLAANQIAGIDSTTLVVLLAKNESAAKVLIPLFSKMADITPAAENRRRWQRFLGAQGVAIDRMAAITRFAGTKQTGGSEQTRAGLQALFQAQFAAADETGRTARAYGAWACGSGVYNQSPTTESGSRTRLATKQFASKPIGVAFDYPAGWRHQEVNGGSPRDSVAFTGATSHCAVFWDKHAAPDGKSSDSDAALAYAQGQVPAGRDAADEYELLGVHAERALNVEGAVIVRSWTADGKQGAGRVAFFFAHGRRYVVDCSTTDVENFGTIDVNEFQPLISSLELTGP